MTPNKYSTIIEELEQLLAENIEQLPIPHVTRHSIRIRQYIVRYSKKAGWLVYNMKENEQVARMFCKTGAVALAKTLAEGTGQSKKIYTIDAIIQKHYLDAMFHKNAVLTTKSEVRRDIADMRYEISWSRVAYNKNQLERIIFSSDK
jgi:hypothetical protein